MRARRKGAAWNGEYLFQFLTGSSESLTKPRDFHGLPVQGIPTPGGVREFTSEVPSSRPGAISNLA
jgi:hypothetical protein